VDSLIANEIEAEQLAGRRDPAQAARILQRMGSRRVIITLGERGVYDGEYRPAFSVKAVDTVGAGDTFVGAFAAALAEDHADPVGFAQAAAALKCTRAGAQSVPTRRAVVKLFSSWAPYSDRGHDVGTG
jgi:ribokinase